MTRISLSSLLALTVSVGFCQTPQVGHTTVPFTTLPIPVILVPAAVLVDKFSLRFITP
jgi:hypothetical protein